MVDYKNFATLDIRVGTVLHADFFKEARNPAYKLEIDFGESIGIKKSSAQLTSLYSPEELIGRQVLAVINFEPKLIAGLKSEVLVLGCYSKNKEVVLIQPDRAIENGSKLG